MFYHMATFVIKWIYPNTNIYITDAPYNSNNKNICEKCARLAVSAR